MRQYPTLNNKVTAWWLRQKSYLKFKIYEDIESLGGKAPYPEITAIVPISPIPSHPKMDILLQTIKSIHYQIPNALIYLCFDGVRPEQNKMTEDYQEHIRRMLWEISEMPNVVPFVFPKYLHQSGIMWYLMDHVFTDLLIYVEQDTPFVLDYKIEWEKCSNLILSGESNMIRFHFEAFIPDAHKGLMLGNPENGFLKTFQWSQRPHLASTAFYRRVISENFTNKSRCFLEDKLHGRLIEEVKRYGIQGWNQWRVHIYFPDEKNIKRSLHLDGRAGLNKYDEKQIW